MLLSTLPFERSRAVNLRAFQKKWPVTTIRI